jgi:hypothetical protein
LRSSAQENKISPATLLYRLKKNNVLKKNAISISEEALILKHIEVRQKGAPLTKSELMNSINEYLKVLNPFYFFSLFLNFFFILDEIS